MSLIRRNAAPVQTKDQWLAEQTRGMSPIEKKIFTADWVPAKKDLFFQFFDSLSASQKEAYKSKRLIQWTKTKDFQQMLDTQIQDTLTQFQITSMMMIMMATVDLHFLFSAVLNTYLINFNVDAIVASICVAFLYANTRSQFRLLKRFGILKDYAMLDGLAVALCILVELLVYTLGLDLSIVILIATYFLEKRKLKYYLENNYRKLFT